MHLFSGHPVPGFALPEIRKRLLPVAAAAALAVGLAACGTPPDSAAGAADAGKPSIPSLSPVPSLSALLPPGIRQSKQLNVGSDPTGGAPMVFYAPDGKTLQGVEPDLVRSISQLLGVQVTFHPGSFDSLLPGLTANRYDMVVSQVGDLKARQGQADFVDYMKAGMVLVAKQGNPAHLTGTNDLCGHTVSVNTGTFEEETLGKLTRTCTEHGKPAIQIQTFTNSDSVRLAVQSGRADAEYCDSGPGGYLVQNSNGRFEQIGPAQIIAYVGIPVAKGNTQLQKALQAALTELISNGTYRSILTKWGQLPNAVEKVTINNSLL
ncbi:ABC transporter substrate-binding protein [Amycolatopsis ultiminotia]|uniref:ABC transporter substrate-binding protein n=1 Tax=Amycolatopsis ultiminotia TaxID=543629 RepID=A0ABP6WKT8_9PSEU